MKNLLIILALISIITLYANEEFKITKAPDFQLENEKGELVKLSDFNDKLIVLDFWATWCVPCKKEMPHLNDISQKYPNQVNVVAVNIDKARRVGKAKAYLKSQGYTFNALFDPDKKAQELYNVVNPPRTVLIAPGMNIIWTHDGYQKGDEVHIQEQIEKWIQSKKIQDSANTNTTELLLSGINEATYIYKNTSDDDFHYYNDALKVKGEYRWFRAGIKFDLGNMPTDFQFIDDDELEQEDFKSDFFDDILTERYIEFTNDHLFLRAGNYEAAFGNGIVLNAYNNTDIKNGDNSLDGGYIEANYNSIKFATLWGQAEVNNDYNYLLGFDIDGTIFNSYKLGLSFVQQDLYNYEDNLNFVSSRFSYSHPKFDFKSEYSWNYFSNEDLSLTDYYGKALYSDVNIYLGKITLTGAYKNYSNFYSLYNELPTVHYNDKGFAEYGKSSSPGFDEEGIQGIIRYNMNEKNEFVINYAEGWNSSNDVKMNDLHTEWIHHFEKSSITFEYSQIERMDEQTTYPKFRWDKEMTPKISYEFKFMGLPMLTKVELEKEEINYYSYKEKFIEQSYQYDVTFNDYSLSTMVTKKSALDETEISDDESEIKIGCELIIKKIKQTEIKIFAGSQKGGTICRNGVCAVQAPFKGIKVNITTRF